MEINRDRYFISYAKNRISLHFPLTSIPEKNDGLVMSYSSHSGIFVAVDSRGDKRTSLDCIGCHSPISIARI